MEEEEKLAAQRQKALTQGDVDVHDELETLMVEYEPAEDFREYMPFEGELSIVRPQASSDRMWTYTLVVLACGFVLGYVNMRSVQFCCRRCRRPSTRTVATQSQTTYQGRFNVLPEALQGVFEGGLPQH